MSIKTYASARRPLIGDAHREAGELVPEAHTWRLVESLLHSGIIAEVEVSEEEFRAAVGRYCPDEAEAVLAAVGLEVLAPEPARKARKKGSAEAPAEPPADPAE